MAITIIGLPELRAMKAEAAHGGLPGDIETLELLLATALFQSEEAERLKKGLHDAAVYVCEKGRTPEWTTTGIPVLLNCLDHDRNLDDFGLREPVVIRNYNVSSPG